MGYKDIPQHISQFDLYVGTDVDYSNNQPCPNGPFVYPRTSDFGTSDLGSYGTNWNNGVEA